MREWEIETEALRGGDGRKVRIRTDGKRLSFAGIAALLATRAKFRTFFNDALAAMPFGAFRWECPPLTGSSAERAFECVALESPELLRPAEADAFAARFEGRKAPEVAGFANLGGDAFLIVPCPGTPPSAYAHLAAFVRRGPAAQRSRLWRQVAETLDARLGAAPVWLNTAGAGVAWLHIRLDSRPKYYCYAPYRDERP